MRRWAIGLLLAGTSAAAQAGDKPLYQPAPAWVKPAPPVDAAKLTDASPVLLVLDHQDRLADGVVWSYADVATRLATPEVVAQAGTLTIPWQPSKGDLIVHKLEIIRGAQHIDVLAGGKTFTVIRREQQLERRQLDGQLTATMPVEGLQPGDVLHIVASITRRETAFGTPTLQSLLMVPADPMRVGFARARFVWPTSAGLHWKSLVAGAAPVVDTANGTTEVMLSGVAPKAPDLPSDAPLRFRKPPAIEVSSFADWAAVSRANEPLYATDGLIKPGGALDGEVKRIAAADPDPARRAAAALQLVQEKVRYLFNGLDNGNYVPQTPEQTWQLRYGDCKAKTLLLLAMLHALGVEAEPALANLGLGDLVPDRLPGLVAFNHVLVRATIAGKTYWLDGTGSGSRYADLGDTPPLRWVLPIRKDGAALMAVPAAAPARPGLSATLDIDQRAGVRLPALLHAMVSLRGPVAAQIGLMKSQGSAEQQRTFVSNMLSAMAGSKVEVSTFSLSYLPSDNLATVDATAISPSRWMRHDGRYRIGLDHVVGDVHFEPDRARPAWASIPVATGAPESVIFVTRLHLPSGLSGVGLDGDASLDAQLAAARVTRHSSIADGVLTTEETLATSGAEIAPADVAAVRTRVALAKARLVAAIAPADLPEPWTSVAAARRDGRLQPLLAAYAQAIAAEPDKAGPYENRAQFELLTFDRPAALPDLNKALLLEPTPALYLRRAEVRRALGDQVGAAADAEAGRKLDPAFYGAVYMLGIADVDAGRKDAAIARVQERIDAGGESRDRMIELKAELLARAGDAAGAVATMDAAIAAKPGLPDLLNERCWVKGQLNTALDTALKDCTHAIELSDSPAQILDSRALVYLRLNRLDEAMADLTAALESTPDRAGSLYLRGIVRHRQGKTEAAKEDFAAVALLAPALPADYKRFGIAP